MTGFEAFDNKSKILKDDLVAKLRAGDKVAVAAAYFSIYGYQELKSQLDGLDGLRFLYTEPTFLKAREDKRVREFYIPRRGRERGVAGTELEIRLRNELTQRAVARECAEWIRSKASFKSLGKGQSFPQSFIQVESADDTLAYLPVEGITAPAIGAAPGSSPFTCIMRQGADVSRQLLALFDQAWEDASATEDVTEQVVESITNMYRENRYQKLMNRVVVTGGRTRVLMLSATPVNNRFRDLQNQLELAYRGNNQDWQEALGLRNDVRATFRNAQSVYGRWSKLEPEERTTKSLMGMLDPDLFKLLDQVTVARSRRQIQRYYDLEAIGPFPKRLDPVTRRPDLSDAPRVGTFRQIAEALDEIKLASYVPSAYIQPSRQRKYEQVGLTFAGREWGLRRLMATNLLKRLESCVESFRLTLDKVTRTIEAKVAMVDEFERTPGKAKARLEARTPTSKTMRPCPDKLVDWDTTQNLYIEGDNLEALKIMRETYAGKVKLIYIDPPYNTGHDFIYDDDFGVSDAAHKDRSGEYNEEGGRLVANPESNGRFHSDWCSMMYPRLLLARDMLSADGVIFISIDDNEQKNLVSICDELFGASCFITNIVWRSSDASNNDAKTFSADYNHTLVYSRSPNWLAQRLPRRAEDNRHYYCCC